MCNAMNLYDKFETLTKSQFKGHGLCVSTTIVRRTVLNYSGDDSSTIKLVIEKKRENRAKEGFLILILERESLERESQYCLLVKKGMSYL